MYFKFYEINLDTGLVLVVYLIHSKEETYNYTSSFKYCLFDAGIILWCIQIN